MSDKCFYKMLGEEFGPVSADDLRDMIRTGQLAGDDEVRMDKGRRGSGSLRLRNCARRKPKEAAPVRIASRRRRLAVYFRP